MDREMIINGLEIILNGCNGIRCEDCVFHVKEPANPAKCGMDEEQIEEAAIALLKEQEAKQGKWERQYSRPGVYANLFWWCSVCGEPTRYNDAGIFYKYCPRCGAKLEPCIET